MKPLAVGDRVRVYCVNLAEQAARFKGTVVSIAADTAMVRVDEYPALKLSAVHVKQCRRLRRVQRRVVYSLVLYAGDLSAPYSDREHAERLLTTYPSTYSKIVELVERRKGKK